jgi:hypothetical protein
MDLSNRSALSGTASFARLSTAIACTLVLACGPESDSPDATASVSDDFVANYDEALVPEYTLPDPLVALSGTHVTDVDTWRSVRRPEILALYEQHVFGETPRGPFGTSTEVLSVEPALAGAAIRKEVRVRLTADPAGPAFIILLYVPSSARGPTPTFLGLNFYGNASIHPDPGITQSTEWMRENDDFGIVDNRATEATRGVRSSRWPVERILERGYGLATLYYGDIDPDYDDGFENGIHPYFDDAAGEPNQWSSIGAWSWGLSRAMDYLVTDRDVDPDRVMVMGHSRLGKAALWAGAQDERFAIVISNDSGAGGAALSRRAYGETVARINDQFPHWFNPVFKRYGEHESELPVDQHMLLSLVAPRPLYVASAIEDQWADPRGEFLSARHAGPVYRLFGEEPLPVEEWPAVDTPVMGTVGYHVRAGGHDVLRYDWERFMDFADMHLRN